MKYSAVTKKIFAIFWHDYAAIYGLWGIAVGYPYVTTLGNHPEFAISQHIGQTGIALTLITILFFLPTIIALCRMLINKKYHRAAGYFDYGFCLLTSLAATLYFTGTEWIMKTFSQETGIAVYALICLLATLGVSMLFYWKKTRDLFRFAATLPIILVIFYLFSPTAEDFSLAIKTKKSYEGKIKTSPPIIVIIMDEFALWALLDQEGTIDPIRFPNLSAFAKDSTWFRNAKSVVPFTAYALPVITTGKATQLEAYRSPKQINFPENMFSWLAKHYDRFNITEFASALAPNKLRENEFELKQYLSDLLFFSYYFYLLKIDVGNLKAKTPSRWCGFAAAQELNLSAWCDRLQGGKTLNFLHMEIPHSPLQYNFDGVKYRRNSLCQTIKNEQVNPNSNSSINLAQHRYMLQCGYVDACVGQIMTTLKKKNIFDSALIIILADHGLTFSPELPLRGGLSLSGMAQGGFIPLLIKQPFQKQGNISDRQATLLDIMPTICGALQTPPPWPMDGNDLFAAEFPKIKYDSTDKRLYCYPHLDKGQKYRAASLNDLLPFLHEKAASMNKLLGNRRPFVETPVNYTGREEYDNLLAKNINTLSIKENHDIAVKVRLSFSVFIEGCISARPPELEKYPLAIGVNNNIFIVTDVYDVERNRNIFGAMIPGGNATPATLSFFLVETTGKTTILHRLTEFKYLDE